MRCEWKCLDNGDCFRAVDAFGRCTAMAVISRDVRAHNSHDFALLATRLMPSSNEPVGTGASWNALNDQAQRLSQKIRFVDSLGLTSTRLAARFMGGRAYIAPETDEIKSDESGINKIIDAIEDRLSVKVVSQVDYDQQGRFAIRCCDSISRMRMSHFPTAVGTFEAFACALKSAAVELRNSAWAILGVGNVGGRLVERLIDCDVRSIRLYDQSPKACTRYEGHPTVTICDHQEWLRSPAHAVVFCGDCGSLSPTTAGILAENEKLVVFGGPEAALDRAEIAIRLLQEQGRLYMPSWLCGAVGLVATLEEILGNGPTFDELIEKYRCRMRSQVSEWRSAFSAARTAW